MPKTPIATIPEDLRKRTDLSIGDANRVVELRKRHESLREQLVGAEAKVANLKRDLEQNEKEETEILKKPAPALAKA